MRTWEVTPLLENTSVRVDADWCGQVEGVLLFLNGPEGDTVLAAMWASGAWSTVRLVEDEPAEAHGCTQCGRQHQSTHKDGLRTCFTCGYTCRF